jgi:hypothetical protein
MTSDLIELYTTKDGVIDSEDDIAASAAILYAGESLQASFPRDRVSLILTLAGSDTASCVSLPSIAKVFLTFSSSTDRRRNHFFHIGSCAVSRGADTRTGRARSCDRPWPAPHI